MTDLVTVLRTHQRQIDADGQEVGMSRQACDEAAAEIERLTAELSLVDKLRAEFAAAMLKVEAERDALRAALAELVSCKDLKERIEGHMMRLAYRPTDHEPEWLTKDRAEYQRRQPLAWQAAREALRGAVQPTVAPKRCRRHNDVKLHELCDCGATEPCAFNRATDQPDAGRTK